MPASRRCCRMLASSIPSKHTADPRLAEAGALHFQQQIGRRVPGADGLPAPRGSSPPCHFFFFVVPSPSPKDPARHDHGHGPANGLRGDERVPVQLRLVRRSGRGRACPGTSYLRTLPVGPSPRLLGRLQSTAWPSSSSDCCPWCSSPAADGRHALPPTRLALTTVALLSPPGFRCSPAASASATRCPPKPHWQ